MEEQSSNTGTPLSEAQPTIAELFVRDPQGLTDEEVDKMVEAMIGGRARWEAEEAEAKAQGRKPLPSKGLTLDNLDL